MIAPNKVAAMAEKKEKENYAFRTFLKNHADPDKLDAQFLQNSERKDVNILESIINMTKNLSTPIIVEGVETAAQVEFLEGLGCRGTQFVKSHIFITFSVK